MGHQMTTRWVVVAKSHFEKSIRLLIYYRPSLMLRCLRHRCLHAVGQFSQPLCKQKHTQTLSMTCGTVWMISPRNPQRGNRECCWWWWSLLRMTLGGAIPSSLCSIYSKESMSTAPTYFTKHHCHTVLRSTRARVPCCIFCSAHARIDQKPIHS